ncbi:unnamed protein product, partial [Staurois parvus]
MTRDCGPLGREGEQVSEFDSGHPTVTDAGAGRSWCWKTAQRWTEEQIRPCRREQLSGWPSILTWWQW